MVGMKKNNQIEDVRLICATCGACASHDEDRVKGRCHHCGEHKTNIQERNAKGEWVTQ